MPNVSASSSVLADPNINIDLKLEAAECRRHGYTLTGKFLGQGAYAKVYLGQASEAKINTNMKLRDAAQPGQKELKVAIKIISTDTAPKIYITKFLPREIATMNRCYKHMNVIQLFDIFATVKRVYLILEFATAGDLLTYINRSCVKNSIHSVPENTARSMFTEISAGLRFIHRRGIAHRDLKCENLLLTNGASIRLSDFGFAIDTTDSKNLLKTHCGSYAYASPEILRQQKYDGKMADLWSLGVVLFAMVNGGLPFRESDAKAVLVAMKKPVYFKSHLTTECKELIRSLLRMKPQKRLTIDEVLSHPWVTKFQHPDSTIALEVPSPYVKSIKPKQHSEGVTASREMEEKIKKHYVPMNDPVNVSKYLCSKMKPGKLVKSSNPSKQLPNSRSKSLCKEWTFKDTENPLILQPTEIKSIPTIDMVPKETKTTQFFPPPPVEPHTLEEGKNNIVEKDIKNAPLATRISEETKNTDQAKKIVKKIVADASSNKEENTGTSKPITVVHEQTETPPIPTPNRQVQNVCTLKRPDSNSPGLISGKTTAARETASPNVINIKIEQIIELKSNSYKEFQRSRQRSNGSNVKPVGGKFDEKTRKNSDKLREFSVKRLNPIYNTGSPALLPRNNTPQEEMKLVPMKMNRDQKRQKTVSVNNVKTKSTSPKQKSSKTQVQDTSHSKKENRSLHEKSEEKRSSSNLNKKPQSNSSQRIVLTTVAQPMNSTHHKPKTSPQNSKTMYPCNTHKERKSPIKVSAQVRISQRNSETLERYKKHPSKGDQEGIQIQVRPYSRKLKRLNTGGGTGEWCKQSKTIISKPEKDRTNSREEIEVNPADAKHLPTKYENIIEQSMDPQQLLSYRVRRGDYGHAIYAQKGKYTPRLPCAYSPIGRGYIATDNPDYRVKVGDRWNQKLSHDDTMYNLAYYADQHSSSRPLHDMQQQFAGQGFGTTDSSRLLYRRFQRPRKTVHSLKQFYEKALIASKNKKNFLPSPSCGVTAKKSDPSLSQWNKLTSNYLKKQKVVLKLHNS